MKGKKLWDEKSNQSVRKKKINHNFFSQCNPERVGKVSHYNIDELENEWCLLEWSSKCININSFEWEFFNSLRFYPTWDISICSCM